MQIHAKSGRILPQVIKVAYSPGGWKIWLFFISFYKVRDKFWHLKMIFGFFFIFQVLKTYDISRIRKNIFIFMQKAYVTSLNSNLTEIGTFWPLLVTFGKNNNWFPRPSLHALVLLRWLWWLWMRMINCVLKKSHNFLLWALARQNTM